VTSSFARFSPRAIRFGAASTRNPSSILLRDSTGRLLAHGSMAHAMPQAIGIQASQPKRQVISLSGDGGFTMLMGDLITLSQEKLPVKVVIFNNGTLGFVALEMKAAGLVELGTDLDNPNFAAMANAMGILGIRAEDPGELPEAVAKMLFT